MLWGFFILKHQFLIFGDKNLSPHPPSLIGKGELFSPPRVGEGLGEGFLGAKCPSPSMYCCLLQGEWEILHKSSQSQRYKRVSSEFHSLRKRL